MNRRKFRPSNVEALETLALPSAGLSQLPAHLVPARHVAHPPQPHLNGALGGTFVAFANPGVGVQINLAAVGSVSPLGPVTASGLAIQSIPPNPRVGANAYLVLTNAQGSVTISLHAPIPKRGSLIPPQFQFSIVGGTGNYANLTDRGTARLNYQIVPVTPVAGQTVAPAAQGNFSIQFYSSRGR